MWYEDLTGSGTSDVKGGGVGTDSVGVGVETIAHLRENKRITVMFTAFDKPPRIARLFGTGESRFRQHASLAAG